MIEAKILCDSVGAESPRLTTFQLRYPRFIHSEFLTHRMFSRNSSSSRATVTKSLLDEVRSSNRVTPSYFGKNQKGMRAEHELTDDELYECKRSWVAAAFDAAYWAEKMLNNNCHKQIVNRLLEPYTHINVICTGVESAYLNFFGLRLDKTAQPEMKLLAEAMWQQWNERKPAIFHFGVWHLPLITPDDYDRSGGIEIETAKKISVGRCAHVSYGTDLLPIEKAIRLHDFLLTNRHFSPFEHQATPDVEYWNNNNDFGWRNSDQHGNLTGWKQYRKQLPNENIAPLPVEYQ